MTPWYPSRLEERAGNPVQCVAQESNLPCVSCDRFTGGLSPQGSSDACFNPDRRVGIEPTLPRRAALYLGLASTASDDSSRLPGSGTGGSRTHTHQGLSLAALPVRAPCQFQSLRWESNPRFRHTRTASYRYNTKASVLPPVGQASSLPLLGMAGWKPAPRKHSEEHPAGFEPAPPPWQSGMRPPTPRVPSVAITNSTGGRIRTDNGRFGVGGFAVRTTPASRTSRRSGSRTHTFRYPKPAAYRQAFPPMQ